MTDDDDVNQPRCVDIGDDGIDPLGDGGRFEVARLAAVAGKVDGEHVLFGCLLVQFLDGEIPAVASVSAAVDEDQRGRCLGPPASPTPASPRPPQASATASNLWSTLKTELIYWPATTFATRAAAEAALFRYMTAGFNQRRIQAGLDGLSPDEYEHAWKASRPHPNRLPSNQTPPIPDSKVSGKSGEL